MIFCIINCYSHKCDEIQDEKSYVNRKNHRKSKKNFKNKTKNHTSLYMYFIKLMHLTLNML